MKPDFYDIAERFDDDHTFLNHLWEDGFVQGFFVGSVIVAIVVACFALI